ncbi:tetratricopeptide repeat protein [candidate division KSB1 bacterium]
MKNYILLSICICFAIPGTAQEKSYQTVSLLGEKLYIPQLEQKAESLYKENLEKARVEYEKDKNNAETIIWFGRRTAYLGDYRKAIKIFSEGISKHPNDARMFRHRGHRYISIREFDKAIKDFNKAAELIKGTEDKIEPDGIPNASNIPVSSLHTNIWYHLGLAYYLKNDLPNAGSAYGKCIEASTNDDMLAAASHWQYMILRRLGKKEKAEKVLESINPDMNIIENTAYHKLLLFYKGLLSLDELTNTKYNWIMNPAVQYGLGNWYFYNNNKKKAKEIFENILKSEQWAPFGYIAAEADLSRFK